MEKRYIEYAGKKFVIYDGVYTPSDDSYMIADVILKEEELGDALDMCAGCGFLGIIASDMASSVTLVDDDEIAVRNIEENVKLNSARNCRWILSDLFERVDGTFDTIIFNPPFLPTEYEGCHYLYDESFEKWRSVGWHAWDGGIDGRKVIDRFLDSFYPHLRNGGRLYAIGSSLSDYKKTVRILRSLGMKVKIASRKRYFFEELVVMVASKP